MSNLASVQRILALEPIDGADAIEKATILGWQVVVKNGEFQVGQLVTYIQIDTVAPDKPEFEFLRERNFRIRTIKLRKQISQGLIIPLPKGNWGEGDDVTEVIGIKKYEKPDNNPISDKPQMPKKGLVKYAYIFKYNYLYKWFPSLRPKMRSPFPTNLIPITDEERIQNLPHILEKYKGMVFYTSYKLDGSSITIIHSKGFFGKSKYRICSRRFELHDKKNDWYKVFKETNFADEIQKIVKYYNTNNVMVQGEAIGKFNGNHHNLQNNQIRLFNIFVDGKPLYPIEFHKFTKASNIPVCPLYKKLEIPSTIEEILKISEIPDALNPSADAEGLVWRSIDDSTSFKVINNKYLLKND